MRYMPIWLDVSDKVCVVVGGGDVAARKADMLLKAGAKLHIVAPDISANMSQILNKPKTVHIAREFCDGDLDDAALVIAATNVITVNKRVHYAAKIRRVLINVVDTPELCDYINGALVERDPMFISISSSGHSPTLARSIKADLEVLLPSNYGKLVELIGRYRDQVNKAIQSASQRLDFWRDVVDGPVASYFLAGQTEQATALLATKVDGVGNCEQQGEVYLIGAGPGDPDLLTLKAFRLLQRADVIIYDRLISEPIMNICRRDAERIYVGKLANDHSVPQEEISQMLVDLAKQGRKVARLKGGDPFMFGRGGEEIALLVEHQVLFQVIPGVTSATGCAAYAGIPLTHRDYAQACIFVTGHTKNDKLQHLNWPQLAGPNQTVVFYMGLKNARCICEHLIRYGASKDRPAALIEQGTTMSQRVIVGTLSTLPDQIDKASVKAPSLIMVGEVVGLQKKFEWYKGSLNEQTTFPFRHKFN